MWFIWDMSPENSQRREWEHETRKGKQQMTLTEQVTTVGDWRLSPLGNSGSPCRRPTFLADERAGNLAMSLPNH